MKTERMIKIEFKNDAKDMIVKNVMNTYDKGMCGRGIITELKTCFIDELSRFLLQNYSKINENRSKSEYTNINARYEKNIVFEIN